ncbi:MAG TPA: hypothetical protein VFW90_04285 [Candidatus Saccharimonadales bacterium]|nr:hypothetical protein [Candidatus Saccharimonadales bacterium]
MRGNENSKLVELMHKANERWWKMQVFLGKNALTKLIAMEGVGTVVDVSLMGSGMHDPLTREPVAALVDLGVLHKLSGVHEEAKHPETGRLAKAKKLGGTVMMLAAAISAQKAGLAVAEHAHLAQGFDGGVQLGSKWAALLSINGANTLRQKPH